MPNYRNKYHADFDDLAGADLVAGLLQGIVHPVETISDAAKRLAWEINDIKNAKENRLKISPGQVSRTLYNLKKRKLIEIKKENGKLKIAE